MLNDSTLKPLLPSILDLGLSIRPTLFPLCQIRGVSLCGRGFYSTLIPSPLLLYKIGLLSSIDKPTPLLSKSCKLISRPEGYMGEVKMVREGSRRLLAGGPAWAPAESMRQELYRSEAAIDSDLVVILAALLCALICALGLNSLFRCALRCTRRSAAFQDDVAARLANTGLKKAAMKALPTTVYGIPCQLSGVGEDCPICLAEFREGESLRVLPKCHHAFHVECIDTWLASHSSCPTCRHCLKKKPLPAPATCCAPPVPEACGAAPTPVTCGGPPVAPSDVIQIVVESPASDRPSQGRADAGAPAVSGSGAPQESSSEHSTEADVS